MTTSPLSDTCRLPALSRSVLFSRLRRPQSALSALLQLRQSASSNAESVDTSWTARTAECGNPICNLDNRTFGRIYSICPETGSVDRILQGFKYADRPTGWSVIFGRLVLGWLDDNLDPDEYDAIIANPTEPTRPVRHTELILEAAAKEDLEDIWPIYPDALQKALSHDPVRSIWGPVARRSGMPPRNSRE